MPWATCMAARRGWRSLHQMIAADLLGAAGCGGDLAASGRLCRSRAGQRGCREAADGRAAGTGPSRGEPDRQPRGDDAGGAGGRRSRRGRALAVQRRGRVAGKLGGIGRQFPADLARGGAGGAAGVPRPPRAAPCGGRISVRPCRHPPRHVRSRSRRGTICCGCASRSCRIAAISGSVVVHGHTPAREPQVRPNRIGIDTGAVLGGSLTCAVLEEARRRVPVCLTERDRPPLHGAAAAAEG